MKKEETEIGYFIHLPKEEEMMWCLCFVRETEIHLYFVRT